jgi:hypothetical protein
MRRRRRRGTLLIAAAREENRRLDERSGGLSGSGDGLARSSAERSSTGGEHNEASSVTGVDGGESASRGSECDGDDFAQLDDTRR